LLDAVRSGAYRGRLAADESVEGRPCRRGSWRPGRGRGREGSAAMVVECEMCGKAATVVVMAGGRKVGGVQRHDARGGGARR
jgi:hypothetical protein